MFAKNLVNANCIKIIVKNKVTKPGFLNGLSVEMVLDPSNKLNTFPYHRGLSVFIHNKSIESGGFIEYVQGILDMLIMFVKIHLSVLNTRI